MVIDIHLGRSNLDFEPAWKRAIEHKPVLETACKKNKIMKSEQLSELVDLLLMSQNPGDFSRVAFFALANDELFPERKVEKIVKSFEDVFGSTSVPMAIRNVTHAVWKFEPKHLHLLFDALQMYLVDLNPEFWPVWATGCLLGVLEILKTSSFIPVEQEGSDHRPIHFMMRILEKVDEAKFKQEHYDLLGKGLVGFMTYKSPEHAVNRVGLLKELLRSLNELMEKTHAHTRHPKSAISVFSADVVHKALGHYFSSADGLRMLYRYMTESSK